MITVFNCKKNMCILPEDLKNFFLTTNGLLIQWSIKFDGNDDSFLAVGLYRN